MDTEISYDTDPEMDNLLARLAIAVQRIKQQTSQAREGRRQRLEEMIASAGLEPNYQAAA